MLWLRKKGQSTAEYAIVIGLVIAAIVAMQIYVKRGLQAKVKDAVDYNEAGTSSVLGKTSQYEPYYTQSSMTSTQTGTEKESTAIGGGITKETETTAGRTGTQTITGAVNQ